MRRGLKYSIDSGGVVTLKKDVDNIVESLLSNKFVIDLYDNIEEANEQVTFLVRESGLDYNEMCDYLKALSKKNNT